MSDRTSRIEVPDLIPQLTLSDVANAGPDYVRQGRIRVLHYRADRPGIGLRVRYTQPPPRVDGAVLPPFWQNAPLHGNSSLLSRPWSRRIETTVSIGIGSSALDYTLTGSEISLWVPGDSVSVDVSLTHHVRWHRSSTTPILATAVRTDPKDPNVIAEVPPILTMASAWQAPVQSGACELVYTDVVTLSRAGDTRPLSIIPPWARWVTVYPSETTSATNWTTTFLWPYLGPPIGQTLMSTLQQSSTTHASMRPLPIPPGAVFCSVGGITQPVVDWTFTYTGTL